MGEKIVLNILQGYKVDPDSYLARAENIVDRLDCLEVFSLLSKL